MKFRPCIDLHNGSVKQIVGSTLSAKAEESLQTNFTSKNPASWYAELYKSDQLTGGHVIRLGPGNDEAARDALSGWRNGFQLGGGITAENAEYWLNEGASDVIVTSYVFKNGQIHMDRLKKLFKTVGKENLVLDLSCRKREGNYWIVTDQWQKFTEVRVDDASLDFFSEYCHEFLIHAVDVEGKCNGIEEELVELLGNWNKTPITYAGGISTWEDIEAIRIKGRDRLDFTVGSALDIFGGTKLKYKDLAELSKTQVC
ncbi:phosphoribosylformimino-5-aminoimidazole carboxamide ribotide isomerase [bacterium]|nr:phosphoribosylformimino-5-aminoimidazole carboxamide ribotide isomerase [bacterium]